MIEFIKNIATILNNKEFKKEQICKLWRKNADQSEGHWFHTAMRYCISATLFLTLYSARINGFCHVVAPPKNESFIGQSTKMSCNYLLATEIKILRQKVMFSRVFLCLLSKFVILFFLATNHITQRTAFWFWWKNRDVAHSLSEVYFFRWRWKEF